MVLAVNITQEDAKKTENMLTSTIALATIMKISKEKVCFADCVKHTFLFM